MSSATSSLRQIFEGHLIPILAERSFVRSGTTFRRRSGAATQVVHLQRGPRNTDAYATFYLNGGVYVPALDEVLGAPVRETPDEPSCHVRLRPNRVTATGQDEYTVSRDTDMTTLAAAAASDLGMLIDALDRFVEPEDAVAYLSTQFLAQYERVLGWYLSTGQLDAAQHFVESLQAKFGAQPRWQIFAAKLDTVCLHVSGDTSWRQWTEN